MDEAEEEWVGGKEMNRARKEGRENKREQRDLERKRRAVLTVTDASVLDCCSNTNHNLADTAELLHTAGETSPRFTFITGFTLK